MLRYFANGRLRWKNPMVCNTRTNWEFYAVIDGRAGPAFRDDEPAALHEKTLWIFSPECSHAWVDDGRHKYHRIVFHFGSVPYPLDEIVRARGWFSKKLTDAEIVRLRAIAAEVEPHFREPNFISPIVFQGRLMDLTALALADKVASQPPALSDLATFKVERALSWHAEHLARNPSMKEVADAIHISPSHLRRLFWQVRKASPKTVFQRIRLEKAQALMSRTALTLEDVARHCGFTNASHLCRDYKACYHFTPTFWRKKLVAGYSKPLPPGVVPVREFSARPADARSPPDSARGAPSARHGRPVAERASVSSENQRPSVPVPPPRALTSLQTFPSRVSRHRSRESLDRYLPLKVLESTRPWKSPTTSNPTKPCSTRSSPPTAARKRCR